MGLSSLTYLAPVRRYVQPPRRDYERLEEALALAEAGRGADAVAAVLAHFFPDRALPDLKRHAFTFTQGSSRVSTRIEGDELLVVVPLVRLPTGGAAIAALRHVLTNISGTGQLHQPHLIGDELRLEYRDPLSRMHPAKLVEVLSRMATEADSTNDWLMGQFGATALERAPGDALDAIELERSQALWQLHWREVEALLKQSRRQQSLFLLNELTSYATQRVLFALPLIGVLALRLAEAASGFNDGEEEPLKRLAVLAKCVKEMKAVSPDELARCLVHAEYAISPRSEGTPAMLSRFLGPGPYREQIDQRRGSGQPLDATMALAATYYHLLTQSTWPDEVVAALQEGLAAASERPWREAATILFEHAATVVERFGGDDDDDDDDAEGGDDA